MVSRRKCVIIVLSKEKDKPSSACHMLLLIPRNLCRSVVTHILSKQAIILSFLLLHKILRHQLKKSSSIENPTQDSSCCQSSRSYISRV